VTPRKPSPTAGARDLVAFITAASQAGFFCECRSYAPHNDWVSVSVMLEEFHDGYRTSCAGAFNVYVQGIYAGDRSMTHASRVGIALARQAGLLHALRAQALESLNDDNKPEAQHAWLERGQAELARRAEYQAMLDAKYGPTTNTNETKSEP
jgi:hypothetical protein